MRPEIASRKMEASSGDTALIEAGRIHREAGIEWRNELTGWWVGELNGVRES
jgi:hypothetical protein